MKTLRNKPLGAGNLNRTFDKKLDSLQSLLSVHGVKADVLKVDNGIVTISPSSKVDFYVAKSLFLKEGYGIAQALVL